MAYPIKSFRLFQWLSFFFFFITTKEAFYHFKWPPRISPFFATWEETLVKVMLCRLALYVPGSSAESNGIKQKCLSAPAESSAPHLSTFVKPTCMQSYVTWCVSSLSCWPLQRDHHSYRPSAPVVLPPGKHSMENQSHQQPRSSEKMNVTVLNQPKMQKKISLPLQREGKSGRSLNRPEHCPHHWKLVIGLNFALRQRNRLHVSYPFLNCKWQQQLPM